MRIDPRHPETEALWRAVARAEVRSVAVVSARPGEGCTTVAEAIWRRAACAGRSALLVDLNRDRPALGARLGEAPPGTIQRFGNEGLGLLADPGEAALEAWRDPAQLRDAVTGWLRQWDTVVLDAAPVVSRGAQGVAGLAAAAAADAALLVVLAGRTSATAVREAGGALVQAGARLLGTVLNDRDNPSLRTELERQTRRIGRIMPKLADRVAMAVARSNLLGMRV